MKHSFEEPSMEIIRFAVEDTITVSGVRGGGAISGFDEVEPNRPPIPTLFPPCIAS